MSYNRLEQAFSLIECMMYLSCASLLGLFAFGFASSLYHDMAGMRSIMHASLYLQLARDVVQRDLLGACEWLHDYVPEQNIFKKYWIDDVGHQHAAWVGYHVTPKGFARVQGSYNQKTGSWSKKSISYLPAHIDSLDLFCQIDEKTKRVQSITMTYFVVQQGKKQELSDRSLVRNKVI